MVNVFRKGKLKLLAMSKGELKGTEEILGYELSGISAGVYKMEWAKESLIFC